MDEPHQEELPAPLEQGLRAAFGDPPRAASPSVLLALQRRAHTRLGVQLPGAGALPDTPAGAPAGPPPRQDPGARYRLLGEIGRGGMGVVFRGRDVDLGREVAMKVLRPEHAANPAALERFVEEAQIGGQLQHPGIVPVYELGLHGFVGQEGEQPYFAMKLIQGSTLAEILRQRLEPAAGRQELLRVFEQVGQAMAYAHARGVVHRDLKPGNVMIGSFGEVQVVDWGFAKVLRPAAGAAGPRPAGAGAGPEAAAEVATLRTQSDSSQSVAGSVLGTPAYMPPEQALGQVERMDCRSDVFSLGAMLCEILTGQPPYDAARGDVLGQAARAELGPAQERLAGSGADPELVALCRDCLAADPAARPATAQQVAERIRGFLSSLAERAHAAQVHAAAARVRARATLLFAAAAVVVLAVATGVWLWLAQSAAARRAQATQQVDQALNAATESLGAARAAAGEDPSGWEPALAAADRAVALAGNADVAPQARERAASQLTTVTRERSAAQAQAVQRAQDQATRQRLTELRIPTDDDVRAAGWPEREARRLDGAYADAFQRVVGGRSVAELTADGLQAALAGTGIAADLAAALDHWAMVRDQLADSSPAPDAAQTAGLRAAARRLDPDDPWRNQLRALLAEGRSQRAGIERLAEAVDVASLPAPSVVLLGETLWHLDARERAIAVYRRGQELRPGDFGLCFRLAVCLECLTRPRLEDAAAFYRVALALRPGMNEVRHRLGFALFRLRAWDAAERVFADLVQGEPDNAHWHAHLADAFQALGRSDRAVASYQRAVQLDGTRAHAHNGLGLALAARGDLAAAAAAYHRALELDPGSASPHANLGSLLIRQGRASDAAVECRAALARDPDLPEGHFSLGLALRAQGQLEAAIQSFRRALQLDGTRAELHNGLGAALAEQRQLDLAVPSYRRALELDPGLTSAHINLGNALFKQLRSAEAIASFRQALALDEDRVDAHNGLGLALARQGDLPEAIESYQRGLVLEPDSAILHTNLGNALARQGHLEEAIRSHERALALQPTSTDVLVNLGLALTDQGDVAGAIERYRQAIALAPRLAGAHAGLGAALIRQGALEEAVASLRKALALDPTLARVQDSLGGVLVRLGRRDEAIPCFRRAIELQPRLLSPLVHLAWLHVTAADSRPRDWAEAAALAWRAVEVAPEDPSARLAHGAALYRAGEFEAGAEALERALPLVKGPQSIACGLFLAMAHQRLGQTEPAQRAFGRALRALERLEAPDAELQHLRDEAAQALGVTDRK